MSFSGHFSDCVFYPEYKLYQLISVNLGSTNPEFHVFCKINNAVYIQME